MKSIFKLTTLILVTPSLFTFIFPSASQAQNNQFDTCLRELTTSGVPIKEAQTGCANALVPTALSNCVNNITTNTEIKSIDALKSCYQVRRPIDMGNCVVNINRESLLVATKSNSTKTTTTTETKTPSNTTETEPTTVTSEATDMITEEKPLDTGVSPLMMALNTCQASLLPLRHSDCVTALSRTPQVSNAVQAMTTCIQAEDFPRDLFPSYQ